MLADRRRQEEDISLKESFEDELECKKEQEEEEKEPDLRENVEGGERGGIDIEGAGEKEEQ